MKQSVLLFSIFFISLLSAQVRKYEALFEKIDEFYYTDKDSLQYYLDKTLNIVRENGNNDDVLDVLITDVYTSCYHFDIDRGKHKIIEIDNFIKNRDSIFVAKYEIVIPFAKGVYYNTIGDEDKKDFFFNEVLNIANDRGVESLTNDDLQILIESNNFLAKKYRQENKNNLAREYYQNNLSILRGKSESLKHQFYTTNSSLAALLASERKTLESNAILKPSIEYFKTKSNSSKLVAMYNVLIDNYLYENNIDSAKVYLKSIENELHYGHPQYYRLFEIKSKVFEKDKEYNNAESEFSNYRKYLKNKYAIEHGLDIAESYLKEGSLNKRFKFPYKAIKKYNLALEQFSDSTNSSIDNTILLKILKNKADAENSIKENNNALVTSEKAIAVLDTLKPTFKNYKDKLFLVENAFPVFENAIEASYHLFLQTNDGKFIDKAFKFFEESKSVLLLEAMLASKATEFVDIPKDLLEKDLQLKSKINFYEKKLINKKTKEYQDLLFDLKSEQRQLLKDIETNYKSYYNLKYNTDVISLSEMQNFLKSNEMLVSYFYGTNALYSISISANKKYFNKIELNNNLKDEILAFKRMLQNPKSDIELIGTQSNRLYKKVLHTSLENIQAKRLIIIPDGLLNTIPFESFNTLDNGIKYLIENKAISYINSATLLRELAFETKNNKILAFAPSFKGTRINTNTRSELLPLVHNVNEVSSITNYFKGKIFTGDDATLKAFNENKLNYGILHFATHAILNDKYPEYSYLAFTNKLNEEENILYTSDIYNTKINANLVTLSACETGLGKLQKGEGAISLARSFFYAGASSIANTLWKINDVSSSRLMETFYKNLADGQTKDEALQHAKINFLTTNKDNKLSHPYYWSGFVITGNTTPLVTSSFTLWIIATCTIVLTLFLFFMLKSKNKKV